MIARGMTLLVGLLLTFAVAADPVTVEKHPPTTQFVSFDPKHPPKDVPKLQHGEDALTRMLFNCTVKLKYKTIDKRYRDGEWHVTARLQDIKLNLELTNTIYLPEHANAKLRSHELGHARINGMIYEEAEKAARAAGEAGFARTWTGTGANEDSASKSATDAAVDSICKQYLKETADKAFRIGEIYDDLTQHGTNAKQEDDALREAIQKQLREQR